MSLCSLGKKILEQFEVEDFLELNDEGWRVFFEHCHECEICWETVSVTIEVQGSNDESFPWILNRSLRLLRHNCIYQNIGNIHLFSPEIRPCPRLIEIREELGIKDSREISETSLDLIFEHEDICECCKKNNTIMAILIKEVLPFVIAMKEVDNV